MVGLLCMQGAYGSRRLQEAPRRSHDTEEGRLTKHDQDAGKRVVSANLLHGFEQFNLQNTVRNAFPLTCPSGYVLIPPLLGYVDSAVEGGIYGPRISQCAAARSLHQRLRGVSGRVGPL